MNSNQKPRLTTEEFEVRVWGFVVGVVTLILCFIVIALLYSVTFVTQPIKSMAPIDQDAQRHCSVDCGRYWWGDD